MGRLFWARVALAVFCCPSALPQQNYNPAEVTSAGDAYTSYNVVYDGLFVLDVGIDDDGSIRGIEPFRNPGSMFDTAKTVVREWKFQPAFEGRKAKTSRLTVAFVYRPPNFVTFGAVPPKDFTPVIPSAQSCDGREDYAPVGITAFAYPDYPVNSVTWGSVILQATVDSEGNAKKVVVLHGMANFNRFARAALKNWRFSAATLHGKTVTSNIVVAFIFQPPASSN